jgi:DNA ligase D-like protein (predicted ligase)
MADAAAGGKAPGTGRDPKPAWIDPELATLTKDRFSSSDWMYERKFDGERCLSFRDGDTIRLMTRNQHQVNGTYPELVDALCAAGADDFIIDGEVVAFEGEQTRFARLQQRMQVARPSETLIRSVPVIYYVFDLMYAEGHDLRSTPLRDRKEPLRTLLPFDDPVRYTEHRTGDGVAYYKEACQQGWEGIIAKRASSMYRSGRTRDWLKFKCENSQEFVIAGFTDPQGSRTGLGALLLGYYDADGNLVYAGKVGTGFDQRTLRLLYTELSAMERDRPPFAHADDLPRGRVHWTEPRLVANVGFSEWTTAGQLRHPRFQGLRRDKSPAEVVREVPQGG